MSKFHVHINGVLEAEGIDSALRLISEHLLADLKEIESGQEAEDHDLPGIKIVIKPECPMPNDPLTPQELAEMKARCEKATAGPWINNGAVIEGPDDGYRNSMMIYDEGGHDEHDAAFIAHARADLPRLIAAYEALLASVERPATNKGDCQDA